MVQGAEAVQLAADGRAGCRGEGFGWDSLSRHSNGTNSQRRFGVEVKIGVVESSRELTVASGQTPDEVQSLVADALKNPDGVLTLEDEKGRRFIVPSAKLAYVEIGASEPQKVGFGVG